MTSPILNRLRVSVALLPLVVAVATVAGPAQLAHASDHTLTFSPSETYTSQSEDHGGPYSSPGCDVTYPPGTLLVGYDHFVSTDPLGDDFEDCVHQTALRFDLSRIHQYPGAVPTRATLTYTDWVPDWELYLDNRQIADPHELHGDAAIWGRTCVYQMNIPSSDWRGGSGLVPNTSYDSVYRTNATTWDVTNEARTWYSQPDYANFGLMFRGFDENGGFINSAACVSQLSNFKLQVDFVANDPPAPPPPAPTPFPTVPPLPPSVRVAQIAPQFTPTADLLVSNVAVKGKNARTANACLAGDNVVTATIKNDGGAPAVDVDDSLDAQTPQIVVALVIDGKERVRTVTLILQAGEERTVAFDAIKLAKGTHALQVVIDPNNRVSESDKTNNTFTENKLVCK
jgi:hypothetical protein